MHNSPRRVVDSLPGLVCTADADGQIDFLDRSWHEYTGLSHEEAWGELWQRAILTAGQAEEFESRSRLGALTAAIAHELNQPLTGVITNASTCLRMLAAQPPNIDGALETARRTIRDGNRASDIISRLCALFGSKGAAIEAVDLNELAREVIALSSSELHVNRVVIRSELVDGIPCVPGDRVQLQMVILNLMRNASDAMTEIDTRPRQLMIRTLFDEHHVHLAVEDCGVGLRRDIEERVFDAFYTTKRDGMGIGLAVSRSIIERHRGRLWAERNAGPGATFRFSIPLASGSA